MDSFISNDLPPNEQICNENIMSVFDDFCFFYCQSFLLSNLVRVFLPSVVTPGVHFRPFLPTEVSENFHFLKYLGNT